MSSRQSKRQPRFSAGLTYRELADSNTLRAHVPSGNDCSLSRKERNDPRCCRHQDGHLAVLDGAFVVVAHPASRRQVKTSINCFLAVDTGGNAQPTPSFCNRYPNNFSLVGTTALSALCKRMPLRAARDCFSSATSVLVTKEFFFCYSDVGQHEKDREGLRKSQTRNARARFQEDEKTAALNPNAHESECTWQSFSGSDRNPWIFTNWNCSSL